MASMLPHRVIEDHSFLAEELLVPNVDKCDGGRTNMFISHSGQLVTLNNAELPKVFTRFENAVGKRSSGHLDVDDKMEVIKVFDLFGDNKLIVLRYVDTNTYHIVKFNAVTNLTEYFGYDNTLNKEVQEGKILDPDKMENKWICRNNMYDDNLNLKMGINLKTMFIPKEGRTFEDAIVISKSAAKRLSHTEVYEYFLIVNQNDVLIDQAGVTRNLELLSSIRDNILFARRRINYSTAIPDFKKSSFKKIDMMNDTVYFANGEVVDVEIFSNVLNDVPYNAPIKDILVSQFNVYNELHKLCEEIKSDSGNLLTDDFNYFFNKARLYISSDMDEDAIPYSYDDKIFEGVVIKILVRQEMTCKVGDKLTGRYGSKGVISAIVDDSELPNGVDACVNYLGVLGRKNISQLFEHELNFIADNIVSKHAKYSKKFEEDIMLFYSLVSPELFTFLNSKSVLKKDKDAFFKEIYEKKWVPIHQPPFYNNITVDVMKKLYGEYFPCEKYKFEGINNPMVLGDIYYLKLKHMPKSKFSVRSAGMTDLLDVPYKNNEAYKQHSAQFNSNAIRMGEQELFVMSLLNEPEKLDKFFKCYSSSKSDRESMIYDMFEKDINEIDSFENRFTNDSTSNPAQLVRAMFAGIGLKMVK